MTTPTELAKWLEDRASFERSKLQWNPAADLSIGRKYDEAAKGLRDLAAAQEANEALATKLDQLDKGWAVQHAFQRDAKELAQADLAAAYEALQAAEEDSDSARDRVKSLVLDLSAAIGRYQRAEALAESLKAEKESAVAQERERCAKIVDVPPGTEAWEVIGGEEGLTMLRELAAAIRRGE